MQSWQIYSLPRSSILHMLCDCCRHQLLVQKIQYVVSKKSWYISFPPSFEENNEGKMLSPFWSFICCIVFSLVHLVIFPVSLFYNGVWFFVGCNLYCHQEDNEASQERFSCSTTPQQNSYICSWCHIGGLGCSSWDCWEAYQVSRWWLQDNEGKVVKHYS